MKRNIIFTASFVVMILPFFLPPPAGLSVEGFKALSIFVVCITWWITNVVPLMITSLLAIVLFPVLGLGDSSSVYSYFGNTAVFFLIGSFILSSAFKRSQLTLKIALKIANRFGSTSKGLVLSFQYIATFLSLWMSSHAVVAMLIPIIVELAGAASKASGNERYSKLLFFSALWGATVGGNTTLLGSARAPLALAILNTTTFKSISFTHWMMAALPITVLLSFVVTLVLLKLTPDVDVENIKSVLRRKSERLGKLTKEQALVAVVMTGAIFMWIVFGSKLGLANIALGAVVALFMLKLITWREVEEDVNWGVILMYGGAIVLGQMLNKTGVSSWTVSLINPEVLSPLFFITMVVVAGVLLTEVMSNSAALVIMMQLALPLALELNLPPETVAVAASIATGFAFLLPMSSPSVALTLSTGYVELKDTLRYGIILNLASIPITVFVINTLWRFVF